MAMVDGLVDVVIVTDISENQSFISIAYLVGCHQRIYGSINHN